MRSATRRLALIFALVLVLMGGWASSPAWAGEPVDLNTAAAEQLQTLPGIGPAKAQAILDHRAAHGPFGSVDGLDAVKGFGPATIDKLRPFATVNGQPPAASTAGEASTSRAKGPAPVQKGGGEAGGPPVNLNRASATELQTLPGIGEARAMAIIERREKVGPFTDPSQIMEIKGVGPKTYEKMKDRLVVD